MKTDPEKGLVLLREVLPVLEARKRLTMILCLRHSKVLRERKNIRSVMLCGRIRTAVSGKQNTPGGATELMEVLGKEESLKRIRAGIEKLSQTAEAE